MVLLFWGFWWQQQHSQVNRLQLSDDPLILLSFFNIIFFSESASLFRLVRSRAASASRSTDSSKKREGTKQTLKRRMSKDCSTQATALKDTVFPPSVTISGNSADFPTSDAAASDAQISRVCVSCHGKAHDSDADAAFLP